MRKPVFGFPTRSHTNRAVQPQKMARNLKFRIKVEEGLYYPYGKNKGADQLRGHREADLRLCFRKCKKLVFSWRGSYGLNHCYIPAGVYAGEAVRIQQYPDRCIDEL